MKNIRKILLISIVLFLLSACGANEDKVKAVNSETEEITEVVSDRSIVISEINGNVTVTHNDGEKFNAYEGMNLFDGDDVVVAESSNVTLNIDTDKHLFADENTHFWLTATGSEDSSKTLIHLESGSVLCDIKEKLDDDESFDIQTASSTMCVRGTVFRVCLLNGKDNSVFDLVEVYDGKVWSNIDNTEESVTLEPGQCALIRKNDSNNEQASYVLEEDLNEKFIEETGLNISLENATDGEAGALKISLENVPLNTLSRLETIIEEGTELAVDKEELEKVKEVKEQEKANETLNENHEHKYVEQSRIASTCVTPGSVSYTCSICGDKKTESLPLVGHTPATIKGHSATCTEDGETEGEVCSVCGTVLQSQKTIRATGHKDVLDADGVTHKCSVCGTVLSVDSNKETYLAESLNDDNFNIISYSPTYDSSKEQLLYDLLISGVNLKNATDNQATTVSNAQITAECCIPLNTLSNELPSYDVRYSYNDQTDIYDVTVSGDVETKIKKLISDNLYNYIVRDLSNYKISEIPSVDDSNKWTFTHLVEPVNDTLNYQVQITLSASAVHSVIQQSTGDGNVNINYSFTVNLDYDIKNESFNDSEWDIHTYCIGVNVLNKTGVNTIKSTFISDGKFNAFVDSIETYVKSKINKN